jgi:hypothetical protein
MGGSPLRCITIANCKTCETLFIFVAISHANAQTRDTVDVSAAMDRSVKRIVIGAFVVQLIGSQFAPDG